MRRSFWQKVEDAKKDGITARKFERIENLKESIAYHQNKIEEYKEEIKQIKDTASESRRIREKVSSN